MSAAEKTVRRHVRDKHVQNSKGRTSMLDYLKNTFLYGDKYKTNSEAMIVSCFFNPQKSKYRTEAFNTFYGSIKHLNHTVIEAVIGDSEPELPETDNIKHVHTPNLLWHKEALLNKAVRDLPEKYKYIFWVDADVLFTNRNWLVDGVEQLKKNKIIQPFEYCVHLDKDEKKPSFSMERYHNTMLPNERNDKVWRSFAANYATNNLWQDTKYNNHGHVGFAWGARREVLDQIPLYDKALIGGADHIMAHAAVGQIGHTCITKSFTDDIDAVNEWSGQFYKATQGKLGYVQGDLYHIWHGDVEKRDYFHRIKKFTPQAKNITKKDSNGLYVTDNKQDDNFMLNYFLLREVIGDGHHHTPQEEGFKGFGGGSFGGAGASGSWDTDKSVKGQQQDSNKDADSLNTAAGAIILNDQLQSDSLNNNNKDLTQPIENVQPQDSTLNNMQNNMNDYNSVPDTAAPDYTPFS